MSRTWRRAYYDFTNPYRKLIYINEIITEPTTSGSSSSCHGERPQANDSFSLGFLQSRAFHFRVVPLSASYNFAIHVSRSFSCEKISERLASKQSRFLQFFASVWIREILVAEINGHIKNIGGEVNNLWHNNCPPESRRYFFSPVKQRKIDFHK